MTFERNGRKAGNLARRGAGRHFERPGQLPAQDPPQQFQGGRAERLASPALPAERPSFGDVEGHERRRRRARATAGTGAEDRAGAVEGEQLPVEGAHDQGPTFGQSAQRPHQHAVQGLRWLPLLGHLLGGLGHGQALREAGEVLVQRAPRLDHLGLADDVQLTAFVHEQVHVAQRFEPPTDAALGAADTLGDRPHFAVARP